MTDSEEAIAKKRILRSLTKAQREALATLASDEEWHPRIGKKPGRGTLYSLGQKVVGDPRRMVAQTYTLVEMARPRIENGKWADDEYRLTPLGLRLRAHLLSEQNHD